MVSKVLLTGASGLLGRAALDQLLAHGYHVQGWARRRVKHPRCIAVDMTQADDIAAAIRHFQPDAILHCAAVRRPDEIQHDVDLSLAVNVTATLQLATYAAVHNIPMIYMSTDYVFDGTSPPYSETDRTNPVNDYGRQKVQGENCVLHTAKDKAIILRVPILYGKVEYLGEGAVDEVAKNILAAPEGVPLTFDHYHKRYPLNTSDAADALCLLLQHRLQAGASDTSGAIHGVYQWAGDECLTKYDMAIAFAQSYDLPHGHYVPDAAAPSGGAAATRPHDCRMARGRMQLLGAANKVTFVDGVKAHWSQLVPAARGSHGAQGEHRM